MRGKQLVCLATVVIIIVATFAGLSWYRDEVRSQTFPEDGALDGSVYGNVGVFVEGVSLTALTLKSKVTPIYSTDEGTYCELTMNVYSNNTDSIQFYLRYSYMTDSKELVPVDAIRGSGGGSQWEYLYTDPLTGHELTFFVNDGNLESVRDKGRTVIEYDGSLEFAELDMSVGYHQNVRYVNSVMNMDPTPTTVYRISGYENGTPRQGTVTVTSVSSNLANYNITEYVRVEADIPGTLLPEFITNFYSRLSESGSFYNQNGNLSILLADGTYVESDFVFKVDTTQGWEFLMNGTVTYYTLDDQCDVVTEETLEFYYEVM